MFGEVVATQEVTPNLIRVVLGGAGLADYVPGSQSDQYLNCQFLPPDAGYSVPFLEEEVRGLPREQRPYPRRISVRSWDAERRELTVEIAVHGDVGYAGSWAMRARPGDRLQLRGPAGGYLPHPQAQTYLLVGDESALPAIAASAEQVPPGRRVLAVVEVEDQRGEVALSSPGTLETIWIHRAEHPVEAWPTLLASAVAALPELDGPVSAFVHGEAVETRAVRRHLLVERGLDPELLSCSPYWRRGFTDEEWRSVKAEWARAVAADC